MGVGTTGGQGGDDDGAQEYFKPRKFQEELLEISKQMNTIVYLETGSGKTHIAVLLLKEKRHEIFGPFSSGAKRSVFLAVTNFLVEQQKRYLERFMPTGINVGTFVGNQGVEFWDKEKWLGELEQCHVLVMTPAVLFDAMTANYIAPRRLNLLIFDECHEAVGNAFYRKIMGHVNTKLTAPRDRPLVLGLTATIVNNSAASVYKVEKALEELEYIYKAAVVGPRQAPGSRQYATSAEEFFEEYPDGFAEVGGFGVSKEFLVEVKEAQEEAEAYSIEAEERIKNLLKANLRLQGDVEVSTYNPFLGLKKTFLEWEDIATSLGVFASMAYGQAIVAEITASGNEVIADKKKFNFLLGEAVSLTERASADFQALGMNTSQRISRCVTPKVRRLIEILTDYYNQNPVNDDAVSSDSSDDDEEGVVGADLHKRQRAIVFVQRRATAEGLKCLLEEYARITGNLQEMRVDAVRGVQAPANAYQKQGARMNDAEKREHLLRTQENFQGWHRELRDQLERLDRFRKGNCNLLISTNVLEQGIDVPACNLVIKFDRTTTFKSYVQSRGRARSKPAKFILFSGTKNAYEDEGKVEDWKAVEKRLIKICADRMVPSEDAIQDHLFQFQGLPAFAPSGPMGPSVDPVQAIAKVYKYVGRYGVWYKPIFSYESSGVASPIRGRRTAAIGYSGTEVSFEPRSLRNVEILAQNPLFSAAGDRINEGPGGVGFRCQLCVPPVTSMAANGYRIIQSDWQPRKSLAKQKVCLKACEILLELQELDDHLVVKNLDETVDDPDTKFVDDDPRPEEISNSLVTNDRKNVRIRPYVLSAAFQDSRSQADTPLFLHKLSLKTLEKHPDKSVLASIWAPESAEFSLGLLTRKPIPEVAPFVLFPKQATVQVEVELVSSNVHLTDEELRTLEAFYSKIAVRHVMQIEDPLMELDHSREVEGPLFVPIKNSCVEGEEPKLALKFAAECLQKLKTWNETDPDPNDVALFSDAVVRKKNLADKNFYVVLSINDESDDDDEYMLDDDDEGLGLKIIYQTRSLAMLKSRYADQAPQEPSEKSDEDNVMQLNSTLTFVSPVPASLWLQLLMIPSAFKRIDGLLKAAELRENVNIGARELEVSPTDQPALESIALVPMTQETGQFQREFLQQPPTFAVLEAITSSAANDIINLERLETLGDSALKMVECLNLFMKYPNAAEGPLSGAKGKAVSNKNLKRLVADRINKYWNVAPAMKPRANWLPPLFAQPQTIDRAFLDSSLRQDKWDEGALLSHVASHGLSQLTDEIVHAAVKDLELRDKEGFKVQKLHELKNFVLTGKKTFADCTEALAGVYLSWTGLSGAWTFFKDWVGLSLLPWDDLQSKIQGPVVCESSEEWMRDIIKKVAGVQYRLNYVFNDTMFLVQALTHPSYSGNVWTPPFERLEFLGDAVLDFLVTVLVFNDDRIDTPGKLTRLRSALTCTTTLACLAVENNLHNDLLISDETVIGQINHFAHKTFKKAGPEWMTSDLLDVATLAAVPKALADVFEALVGAVFLDSGLNLEKVRDVFFPLLKNVMETYSSNVPEDPVSVMVEKFGAKFSQAQVQEDGKIRVDCLLDEDYDDYIGQCHGLGPNKVAAKRAAATYTLKQLKKNGFIW